MIEITNLTKSYGERKAVDNISFTVQKGEILGFLGPNGAGKSTTMNMITGYISATEGSIKVDGFDILEQPIEVKKRIGYLPEQPPVYGDMTVSEYLNFVYEIKKVKLDRVKHLEDVMNMVKIYDVRGRMIKNLSKGYQQRVGLAQALMGNPEVLILDEPTVGLDPKQIIEIRNVIKELGKEHTIILSSHILPEVSAICEQVIIINKGRIAAIDTPENLSKGLNKESKLVIRIEGPEEDVLTTMQSVEGVSAVHKQGTKEIESTDYIIESEPNADVRRGLFNALSKKGYPILMLKSMDLSLEDIFLQLTTDENAGKVLSETNDELFDKEYEETQNKEFNNEIAEDEFESEKGDKA